MEQRYAHLMSLDKAHLICPSQRSSGRGGAGNIKYSSTECLSIAEDPEPDDAVSVAPGREAPAAKQTSVSASTSAYLPFGTHSPCILGTHHGEERRGEYRLQHDRAQG